MVSAREYGGRDQERRVPVKSELTTARVSRFRAEIAGVIRANVLHGPVRKNEAQSI
jgi:hypothetical protein